MKYTFYWLTGRKEVLEGETPEKALMSGGYGGGAAAALDFYVKGEDNEYEWDKKERNWVNKQKSEKLK